MHSRRFFIQPEDIAGNTATLQGEEAHHLHTVLRLKTGEKITLFDGSGHRYEAQLTAIRKKTAEAQIVDVRLDPEPRVQLHLGQGLLKGQKMDLVLQKATELGIAQCIPFTSQFSVAQAKAANKKERWERIIIEACKQCNRSRPLAMQPANSFNSVLKTPELESALKLIFWEEEDTIGLKQTFATSPLPSSIFFLIGPEGGFSTEEINLAKQAGFQSVTLGDLTLRAETAAVSAMAILQFLTGNLGGQ